MIKKIGVILAGITLAVFGASVPAQASGTPLHGCAWASVCIWKNSDYNGATTAQTYVAIAHATNQCWQFNSAWNNQIVSWVANFDTPTKEVRLYDSTNCTGTYLYGGQAPAYMADLGTWTNRVGSIRLL